MFRDLLVHVDRSKHCRARVEAAASLAQRFDAHLAAVYVMPPMNISPFLADQYARDAVDDADAKVAADRDEAKDLFEKCASRSGVEAEWIETRGHAADLVALCARTRDMTVLGQADPGEAGLGLAPSLAGHVALSTGRPVLMVPHGGASATFGERILIAWNASAQAARAVNDALPLLARAKRVTILEIGPEIVDEASPGADIGPHLKRHGVEAEVRRMTADDVEVGDLLLSQAADAAADLVVMGVYGHSRVREFVLGGVSRRLLRHATVPLLMSH